MDQVAAGYDLQFGRFSAWWHAPSRGKPICCKFTADVALCLWRNLLTSTIWLFEVLKIHHRSTLESVGHNRGSASNSEEDDDAQIGTPFGSEAALIHQVYLFLNVMFRVWGLRIYIHRFWLPQMLNMQLNLGGFVPTTKARHHRSLDNLSTILITS